MCISFSSWINIDLQEVQHFQRQSYCLYQRRPVKVLWVDRVCVCAHKIWWMCHIIKSVACYPHTLLTWKKRGILFVTHKEEYQMLLTGSPAMHLGQYCPAPRPGAGNTCWQNQTHSNRHMPLNKHAKTWFLYVFGKDQYWTMLL